MKNLFLLFAGVVMWAGASAQNNTANVQNSAKGGNCSASCLFSECYVMCETGRPSCTCSWGWAKCVCKQDDVILIEGEAKLTGKSPKRLIELLSKFGTSASLEAVGFINSMTSNLNAGNFKGYSNDFNQYARAMNSLTPEQQNSVRSLLSELLENGVTESKK